ncbi:Transaldolase [Corynebacterium kutscheri]|uniref:Transaldolase n=1 Tax=Corynebacterium kutscheri TaxID=35755 RepID=A0A0F6TDK7_9CORY|nr:transaldolase [Corynebacterium kutscheri]AKE41276.1 transaldolase [Corynebacterium kutscheri]VEH08552.1 Transaldolase [Corynebacterium kutscheri]VEH09598.1 Transaldolase [Corynebacterium kutscheri]VEH79681.1 Transaldolase [Corynebacterium kutscheri]
MNAIAQLATAGTSTWLDDLSRERITSGNLAEIIATKNIVGVTTNPAIFAAAMSKGDSYDAQIAELKAQGASVDEAVYAMSVDDVRNACDIFLPIFEQSGGQDGRVSIEVDPRISEDRDATLSQARELWKKVDRPNVMIKIPATEGSLPAISDALAEGISVNVTLIFSLPRYREVIAAYIDGINRAAKAGLDVTKIFSVASFFVSRLDSEVDARLEAIGTPQALDLRGQAGVANARRAYHIFTELFDAADLAEGANVQRPLWASTGVKNPDYPQDLYVTHLAGPNTVNTMPEPTIDAAIAGDNITGDTLTGKNDESEAIFAELVEAGIDFEDVFATLEREGVEKFVAAWSELLDSMQARLV